MATLEQRFRAWQRISITEGRWRVTEDLGSGQLTLTIQPPTWAASPFRAINGVCLWNVPHWIVQMFR